MTEIKLVRIYDHEQPEGYRILVDRMWPRGICFFMVLRIGNIIKQLCLRNMLKVKCN